MWELATGEQNKYKTDAIHLQTNETKQTFKEPPVLNENIPTTCKFVVGTFHIFYRLNTAGLSDARGIFQEE